MSDIWVYRRNPETGEYESRPAEWHEAYGMRSSMRPPSTETVEFVRWLEQRIEALEAAIDK